VTDRAVITVRAEAEPAADPYTAEGALRRAVECLEESQRAAAEVNEHIAALKGTSGARRKVIQAFLEMASCRSRRAAQWRAIYVLAAEELQEHGAE
jgi:hypothetical protein